MAIRSKQDIQPLNPQRWDDLTRLLGERGAYSGCWCMWWRAARAEFDRLGSDGRKRAFHRIVTAGTITGILAYQDGEPVGWCSVAPRETYPSLERSRTLARIDDVEAYPVAGGKKLEPVSAFMGVASVFRKAGFEDVARPSGKRRIMRYYIGGSRAAGR